MNKKNLIIIISILILIIFGLIIYISYLKGIEKGESKDKVKKEKNDILCLGEYKSDSGRFIIYDNGTYTGIFDSHSEEGKYTIKKNKLTFTYYDIDTKSDKKYIIVEDKDCSYIEYDNNKYYKVEN